MSKIKSIEIIMNSGRSYTLDSDTANELLIKIDNKGIIKDKALNVNKNGRTELVIYTHNISEMKYEYFD